PGRAASGSPGGPRLGDLDGPYGGGRPGLVALAVRLARRRVILRGAVVETDPVHGRRGALVTAASHDLSPPLQVLVVRPEHQDQRGHRAIRSSSRASRAAWS